MFLFSFLFHNFKYIFFPRFGVYNSLNKLNYYLL